MAWSLSVNNFLMVEIANTSSKVLDIQKWHIAHKPITLFLTILFGDYLPDF